MDKLREAARQALDALEIYGEHAKDCPQYPTYTRPQDYPRCDCGFDKAITALREALAGDNMSPTEQTSTQLMEGYRIGLAEMREKCAKVASSMVLPDASNYPFHISAAIRAIKFEGDTGFRPVSEMIAEKADGEQWSPDDMAYRPSGLSMEQAEQEPVSIVWDASAPVVMDSSAPKNENQEVAELRKQVAALKAVVDAWKNAEQEPVAWVDLEQWQSGEYDCFTSEKVAEYMTPLYAAPVRTKDLTDDEIMKINVDTASIVPTCDRQFHFARAVIAADREKNK